MCDLEPKKQPFKTLDKRSRLKSWCKERCENPGGLCEAEQGREPTARFAKPRRRKDEKKLTITPSICSSESLCHPAWRTAISSPHWSLLLPATSTSSWRLRRSSIRQNSWVRGSSPWASVDDDAPIVGVFGCFDEAWEEWWLHWLTGWWWLRFWVKSSCCCCCCAVLGRKRRGEGEGRPGISNLKRKKSEDRGVFVVRLTAVDDRSSWPSIRVVGRFRGCRHHRGSKCGVLGGIRLSTVDSRWEPWVAVDTRGWPI